MVENALDDIRADSLFLIGLVDDHIPNRGAINEIRQHSAEADQMIAVPGAQRNIGVSQHLFGLFKGAIFRPRRLVKEPQQLRRFKFFLF